MAAPIGIDFAKGHGGTRSLERELDRLRTAAGHADGLVEGQVMAALVKRKDPRRLRLRQVRGCCASALRSPARSPRSSSWLLAVEVIVGLAVEQWRIGHWEKTTPAIEASSPRRIRVAAPRSTERIDGIVATIMAIGRAMVAQEAPRSEYSLFLQPWDGGLFHMFFGFLMMIVFLAICGRGGRAPGALARRIGARSVGRPAKPHVRRSTS